MIDPSAPLDPVSYWRNCWYDAIEKLHAMERDHLAIHTELARLNDEIIPTWLQNWREEKSRADRLEQELTQAQANVKRWKGQFDYLLKMGKL